LDHTTVPVTNPFEPFLERRGVVVLDGGLATELEARGLSLDHPLWSARALAEAPEAVGRVHRDYLEAGADVIETATYQATDPDLLAAGVALAVRERDRFREREPAGGARMRPLVAASIGSFGASLANGAEYRGDYGLEVEALAAWHRPRLRVLEGTGADLLAFETIPSFVEAGAIVRLLAETEGPPAWVSFQARDARLLADGTPIEDALVVVERAPRVLAAGVNCVSPRLVAPLLARCATATSKILVAYPNRGGSWDAASRTWAARGGDVDFAPLVGEWRAAGACLIGGCCRTTPADIRTIAASL
jgi:homocysteine S-methyltransferase